MKGMRLHLAISELCPTRETFLSVPLFESVSCRTRKSPSPLIQSDQRANLPKGMSMSQWYYEEQSAARPGFPRATEAVGGLWWVAAQRSGLEGRDEPMDRSSKD